MLLELFDVIVADMLHSKDSAHKLAFDHELLSTERSERLVPLQRLRFVLLVGRATRKDIKLLEVPPAELRTRSPTRHGRRVVEVDAVRRIPPSRAV